MYRDRWPYSDPEVHADFLTYVDKAKDTPSIDVRNLVAPSGSYEDDVVCLANYPTFCTTSAAYGQTADMTNPSMNALGRMLQGFDGMLLVDAVPYRMQAPASGRIQP
jgi:hypothetical protein